VPLARAFCLVILVSAAVGRQTPPALQSPITPLTASVVVHLPAGKVTYRVGEEIPLELEFRGTGDKDYNFSTATCGFLGHVSSTERVTVTPSDGIDDPVAASPCGSGGSCPGSWHPLDDTPLVIRVSLNDAVRFTRPGAYRVVLTSRRLQRYSSQPAPVLTAAPVDLTIVPMDEAWAATELKTASDLADHGGVADVRHGAALLRYLGTESAALALVERFGAIARVDGSIGAELISLPHRALVIAQMETLVDHGAGLDASFLPTLTELRVLLEMPPSPGDCAARRGREQVVQAEYNARWRAALGPATAAMLGAELAQFQGNPSTDLRKQIAADLEQHPAEAAEAFVALQPSTQQIMLDPAYGWTDVNRPWILPALRQTYLAWRGSPMQNDFPGVGDFALRRLYEMAPDEGRRLILDEIRTGEHAIRYDALAILPDPSAPDLDAPLQARYVSPRPTDSRARNLDRGTTAWLMARYGSPALLPFVTGVVSQRAPSCVVEGGLIAYLLKYSPDAAMKRLDPKLDRSAGCRDPLPLLAARYWDDRIESVALAQLMDADAERASSAAQLLGSHGSSAVKQPLLDRLEKWSKEWQGRAAELVASPFTLSSAARIENSVTNALFQNKRFALTTDDVVHIRALCVTDACRTNVDGLARSIK
jgi:hypothetical protein